MTDKPQAKPGKEGMGLGRLRSSMGETYKQTNNCKTTRNLDIRDVLWEPRKKELPTQIDFTGEIFPEVIFKVGVDG